MVFPPGYKLPGVFGWTKDITYSSTAELVFLLYFLVVLQWLVILNYTYHLMMSWQVLLIITRKGEPAHSLRWLTMVRKLVTGTFANLDIELLYIQGSIRSAKKSAFYFNKTWLTTSSPASSVNFFLCYSLHTPSFPFVLFYTSLTQPRFFFGGGGFWVFVLPLSLRLTNPPI